MARYRKSTQPVLPPRHRPEPAGSYDIYPAHELPSGSIALGFDALAEQLSEAQRVTIDGYGGVLWVEFRAGLDAALARRGRAARWQGVNAALRPEAAIDALLAPFLCGNDPLFGTRYTGTLRDFFDPARLAALRPDAAADLAIVYGCGAALAGWGGPLVYVDLPKNEIQFRTRAGSVTNLGATAPAEPKAAYKRMYFVDWVALNRHKAELLSRLDLLVDGQRPDEPTLVTGATLRAALDAMGRSCFRVRPWFEPGPWGGQWLKGRIPALPQDAPNYAWSFELITPENGLLLRADELLLELSFDLLMYQAHHAVLGEHAERFGYTFPIRFDFLDTFEGGNLSLQCHPQPAYAHEQFGEPFTQDETYYILDAADDAEVYLGFQEQVDPVAFRTALTASAECGVPLDVERFVQRHRARRHDLFLIPSGTIHCSGRNNLVLEISATPYIFTFKLYDWLRLDLDGRPRPLNIDRAFTNLDFSRSGKRVQAELIARPAVIAAGAGWRVVHLQTHPEQFYDVHRLEFEGTIERETGGSPHVLSLVEGRSVTLHSVDGAQRRFSYAETFVVPAAAGSYQLRSDEGREVKVVAAFLKQRSHP
jgi:mannose-6-phosphate isomerase class I